MEEEDQVWYLWSAALYKAYVAVTCAITKEHIYYTTDVLLDLCTDLPLLTVFPNLTNPI